MPRIIILCLFIIAMIGCQDTKTSKDRISEKQVHETFAQLQSNGIDTNQPLLYTYFFKDDKVETLQKIASTLKVDYKIDPIYEDDSSYYWLRMEKKQIHTASSLHDLNTEFYQLAEKNNILGYDGFDIARINPAGNILDSLQKQAVK